MNVWHGVMVRFLVGGLVLGAGCFYRPLEFPAKLEAGDISAVVIGVPPGAFGAPRPLAGARVQILNSSLSRATQGDGRFVLRNLPVGQHTLLITYDPNGDRVPDLARAVKVPVRIPAGQNGRPALDLGNVVLLRPGTLRGTVTGATEGVRVVVEGLPDVVTPDPATGVFEVPNLGMGGWNVVAVRAPTQVLPGLMARASAELTNEGATRDMGNLALQTDPSTLLDFAASILPQPLPGAVGQALSASPLAELIPLWGGQLAQAPGPSGTWVEDRVRITQVYPGIYALRVSGGPDYLPVTIPNVVLPQQGEPLQVVLERNTDPNDQDADGNARRAWECSVAELATRCSQQCDQQPGLIRCDDGADCDDDADGQPDVWEVCGIPDVRSPGGRTAPCHCGETGPVSVLDSCENDSTRFDLNANGVCDLFEEPCRAVNCVTQTDPSDGGVLDASSTDAARADAGDGGRLDAGDAGRLDGSAGDAADAGGTGDAGMLPCVADFTAFKETLTGVQLNGTPSVAWGKVIHLGLLDPTATDEGRVTVADDSALVTPLNPEPRAWALEMTPAHPETPAGDATVLFRVDYLTSAGPKVACLNINVVPPDLSSQTVASVSAGAQHTLILLSNGTVWGMGRNSHGELGNKRRGSPSRQDLEPHPVMMHGEGGKGALQNAVQVAACKDHSLVLLQNGEVWGTGSNALGQLGMAAGPDTQHVVKVADHMNQVACGNGFSALLSQDGGALTLGSNHRGQLGRSTGGSPTDPIAALVSLDGGPLQHVESLAAGFDNAGAVVRTDAGPLLWWWGRDLTQRDGGPLGATVPQAAPDPQGGGDWISGPVFTGDGVFWAVRQAPPGGNLYVLGESHLGASEGHYSIPTQVAPALTLAPRLAGGRGFLVVEEGDLGPKTWVAGGQNTFPIYVEGGGDQQNFHPSEVPENAYAVFGGMGDHLLFLTSSGMGLAGFGRNAEGQLAGRQLESFQPKAEAVRWLLCGNGVKDDGEDCDPTAPANGFGCQPNCRGVPQLDNAELDEGERCDRTVPDGGALSDCLADGVPRCTALKADAGPPNVSPGESCDDGDDRADAGPDGCNRCQLEDVCGRVLYRTTEGDQPVTREELGIPASCSTWWFEVELVPPESDPYGAQAWVLVPGGAAAGIGTGSARVYATSSAGGMCNQHEDVSLMSVGTYQSAITFTPNPPAVCGELDGLPQEVEIRCSQDYGNSRCGLLEFDGSTGLNHVVRVKLESEQAATIRVVVGGST